MTNSDQSREPIRLGIIGTGLAIEKLHWPALRRMPDRFRVVAFSDMNRSHAAHFADYSGTSMDEYSEDYHDLLRRDDVDAVLIALPIAMNLPATRDALEAGKQVVCEKPTGANATEANRFVELEQQYPDRTILIAENWFYRDDLRLARSLLDKEAISRIHMVAWRYVSQLVPRPDEFSSTLWRQNAEYVGGPHLDGGVHHIAEMRLLCGDAERVSGEVQDVNTIYNGPSDLTLNLRFVSGAAGSYAASYPEQATPGEPNDLRIYGSDGVMSVGRGGPRIQRPDGTIEQWRVEQSDAGYYNEWLNFYEAVTGNAPLVGTIVQSARNMEWITRGIASARQGEMMAMAREPIPLSDRAVPLWRPEDAVDLFDGLDTTVSYEATPATQAT